MCSKEASQSFFCNGLCGTLECDCEFSEQLDFYMHTNKDDPDSLTTTDAFFCKKCMRLFSQDETADMHKCKPMHEIENLVSNSSNITHSKDISSDLSISNDSTGAAPVLSNPAQSAGSQEIVGIFWDIENIFIPADKSPAGVVRVLRDKFVCEKREVEFQCVCDTHKEQRSTVDQLNSSLVTVVHVACTTKNAADEKLKQLLVKFSQTYQAPATVVLLSGDVNFSPTLNSLKNYYKFHVILVHNKQCSQPLKDTASELHLFDDLIREVPPPGRRAYVHSSYLVVSGLPVGIVSGKQIHNELDKLCDNTGGKIINMEGDRALVRFQQPDNAARCQRRLNNHFMMGVKITAQLTTDSPSAATDIRPNIASMGDRFIRPTFNRAPRILVHNSYPRAHGPRPRYIAPPPIDGKFKHCLKICPFIDSTSFEVITLQYVDKYLKSLQDILTVERSLPLIDSIAVFVESSLDGGMLMEKIQQKEFGLKKIRLFTGPVEILFYKSFIADAYQVLLRSNYGWMHVRDFYKGYSELKKESCHKEYIDRILSANSSRIVCGFRDEEVFELSILANEDCNPMLNYSVPSNITEIALRLKVNSLLQLPQFHGKMHYFDFLPTFRNVYGSEYFKLNKEGLNLMYIVGKLPDISLLHESKAGICRLYLKLLRSKPTADEMNNFNEQLIKHIFIEKSSTIPFELIQELCSNLFHMKLYSDPSASDGYEELVTAIEGLISQLKVPPKLLCKFAYKILSVKQHLWKLVSEASKTGILLDVLENDFYTKTGQKIPNRTCRCRSSEDLIACIPGLKVFRLQDKVHVNFLSEYYPELHTNQCVQLINAVPSQLLSISEFRTQYQRHYEYPNDFQLESIPQISIHCRDNSVSSVHLSISYLGIEISHLLFQRPKYSIPLMEFSEEFRKYFNKHLMPSVFGLSNNMELFNKLEDYIFIENDHLCLLPHRVFACEVSQVFRKLTHPNESILVSNFHCSFKKVINRELILANYSGGKLTQLLLKVSDVIEVSDVRDEDRLLTLTALGRFVPEPCKLAPISLFNQPKFPSRVHKVAGVDNRKVIEVLSKCENLLYTQGTYSSQITEFEKLFKLNYNEPISIKQLSYDNLIHFFSSFPEFFHIYGSGPASSVTLRSEKVFVSECRELLQIHTTGINVSNFPKEYTTISDGREFNLARYGSYNKFNKLLERVTDSISLLGPNLSWLVLNESSRELIDADKQVDIPWLSSVIESTLLENGAEPLAFDQIPYLYKRIHHCEAPNWISVLIKCPPLMRMYADTLVAKCNYIEKVAKDKRVFFQLSKSKRITLFNFNSTCIFYRKNRMTLPIHEFIASYRSDYFDIDINLLGFQSMEELLNSGYLLLDRVGTCLLVRLSADGMRVLFQMQLVEILFNNEGYSIMVDSVTSKYYNFYGYNLKLNEMGINKLSQLLNHTDIASLTSITGDKKDKCLSLRNETIKREQCRQVLSELSMDHKFPFKYELFSDHYYTKFKEKCDIQMVFNSAGQVVRILGQKDNLQVTSAIYSYPNRKANCIPKEERIPATPEEHSVSNTKTREHSKAAPSYPEGISNYSPQQNAVSIYDDRTNFNAKPVSLHYKSPKITGSPSRNKNNEDRYHPHIRILKRPKDNVPIYSREKVPSDTSPRSTAKSYTQPIERPHNSYRCKSPASLHKVQVSQPVNNTDIADDTADATVSHSELEDNIPSNTADETVLDQLSNQVIVSQPIMPPNEESPQIEKPVLAETVKAKSKISLAANFNLIDDED